MEYAILNLTNYVFLDDPDKLFLLSQLKRLSPEHASSTKMKIMQLVYEAEFEK